MRHKMMRFLAAPLGAIFLGLVGGTAWALEHVGEQFDDVVAEHGATVIQAPGYALKLAYWVEDNTRVPHYAMSYDGVRVDGADMTDFHLWTGRGCFDPTIDPPIPSKTGNIYIVQFYTPAIFQFLADITDLGATPYRPLPSNAYLVYIPGNDVPAIAGLPYVRFIGKYAGAYRLDSSLANEGTLVVEISVFDPNQQHSVTLAVEAMGGTVYAESPNGRYITAKIQAPWIAELSEMDEVEYLTVSLLK